MPLSERPFDVFISYAGENRPFARSLAGWLRKAQIKVWLDEEQLVPGARWRPALQQGVGDSKHLTAILTKDYVQRHWTQRELELFDLNADHSERRLLALELEDIPSSDLDQVFHVTQRIRWSVPNFDSEGFWKLYCGLNNQAPGPRETWENQCSKLLESINDHKNNRLSPTEKFLIQENQLNEFKDLLNIAFDSIQKGGVNLKNTITEIRDNISGFEKNTLLDLVVELWAHGHSEVASIFVLAILPEIHVFRSVWPFVDLNCYAIASSLLLKKSIHGRRNGELWFSLAVWEQDWKSLSHSAKIAPEYISNHFAYLADAAENTKNEFSKAEENFDYGKMITPWNHFHLMWLAKRLNDFDAALNHARRLCSTPATGELRSGRFLNRLLHWPYFGDLRLEILDEIQNARHELNLTDVKTSIDFSRNICEFWQSERDFLFRET